MTKLIFLLILAFTAYVYAYPSQQNLRELPPPTRIPRAACSHNLDNHPHGHDDHHHGHLHDYRDDHDYVDRQPGYDEVYVYIDVPETYSKNSQAFLIEAALIQIEDDADLRKAISDIISSELPDQKTPKYRNPQVVVDNKSPSDPDHILSPEFIRRK